MKYITLAIILVVVLISCKEKEPRFERKAIVLLSGEEEGELFKEQDAVISYLDRNDSVVIKALKLPIFSRPAFAGDSLDIVLKGNSISFTKLYKYKSSGSKRYVYTLYFDGGKRNAIFDNGVLTLGMMDSEGKATNLEFFTYARNSTLSVSLHPIGEPELIAFEIVGELGDSIISIAGFEDEKYILSH